MLPAHDPKPYTLLSDWEDIPPVQDPLGLDTWGGTWDPNTWSSDLDVFVSGEEHHQNSMVPAMSAPPMLIDPDSANALGFAPFDHFNQMRMEPTDIQSHGLEYQPSTSGPVENNLCVFGVENQLLFGNSSHSLVEQTAVGLNADWPPWGVHINDAGNSTIQTPNLESGSPLPLDMAWESGMSQHPEDGTNYNERHIEKKKPNYHEKALTCSCGITLIFMLSRVSIKNVNKSTCTILHACCLGQHKDEQTYLCSSCVWDHVFTKMARKCKDTNTVRCAGSYGKAMLELRNKLNNRSYDKFKIPANHKSLMSEGAGSQLGTRNKLFIAYTGANSKNSSYRSEDTLVKVKCTCSDLEQTVWNRTRHKDLHKTQTSFMHESCYNRAKNKKTDIAFVCWSCKNSPEGHIFHGEPKFTELGIPRCSNSFSSANRAWGVRTDWRWASTINVVDVV
jgi:hypothetical protein